MELFAVLIGAGVAIASPLIPGLRPLAKSAVAGGLAATEATRSAAATAGEYWMDLVAEARVERAAEAEARAATVETITIPAAEN